MLVGPGAETFVEADAHEPDADGEVEDGERVAVPGDDWVDVVAGVEESKPVGEHIEVSVEYHQFPVDLQQFDVRVVDVESGHD